MLAKKEHLLCERSLPNPSLGGCVHSYPGSQTVWDRTYLSVPGCGWPEPRLGSSEGGQEEKGRRKRQRRQKQSDLRPNQESVSEDFPEAEPDCGGPKISQSTDSKPRMKVEL